MVILKCILGKSGGSVVGSCEHSNKTLDSIKDKDFWTGSSTVSFSNSSAYLLGSTFYYMKFSCSESNPDNDEKKK
jgi:hypothetical protein